MESLKKRWRLNYYEGKQFVTELAFIGNDYKRSVKIGSALGAVWQRTL